MKTILYYTSNRENPVFEQKIRNNILEKCGDLPIVSVSQQPIKFGHNICVGDIGHSYLSEFKQILIGAKAAFTEYLVFAEADFLYSKEYFDFIPTGNFYRYDNIWIVFNKGQYYKKKWSNGVQIAKREFIIEVLEKYLKNPKEDYNGEPFEYFTGVIPCVTFKTGDGMRKGSGFEKEKRKYLPYWGEVNELRKKYL
jgi:hypothetical protein